MDAAVDLHDQAMGVPYEINDIRPEGRLASEVQAAYAGTGADVIAFGHYHRSFVRPMPFALLINVASVSIPEDQRPLAAFTVLHARPDGWLVEQSRVPFDPALERAAAAQTGMPPWQAD